MQETSSRLLAAKENSDEVNSVGREASRKVMMRYQVKKSLV